MYILSLPHLTAKTSVQGLKKVFPPYLRLALVQWPLTYWAEKSINIVIEYTKRCGIALFVGGGVCFLKKNHFVYIFIRKS